MSVGRRALPALLALAAALADARGAHGLAFDALLAAVPFTAVAGARLVRRLPRATATSSVGGLQALLWALALCLVVLSCAVRSPATEAGVVPPLGASALVALPGGLRAEGGRRRRAVRAPRAAAGEALEGQRVRRRAGDVDQRCHEEERADRDGDADRRRRRPAAARAAATPPAGASCSSAASRKYIARTIPR